LRALVTRGGGLVPLSPLVDRLEVEEKALRGSCPVRVGEARDAAHTHVWDDAEPPTTDMPHSRSRDDAGENGTRLPVSMQRARYYVRVDSAGNRLVVIIPSMARQDRESKLDAEHVAYARASGAIGDALTGSTTEQRRLEPEVGGHDLAELSRADRKLL
jgi:hypothetical protein